MARRVTSGQSTPKRAARTRSRPKASASGAAPAALEPLEQRLQTLAESLQRALDTAPRADDFQPLADHLYSFASLAPRLLESLQGVSEALHFAHDNFNESLLRLPRAEDFEPLAVPLREFARVSPALTESLAQTLRLLRPLSQTVERLDAVGVVLAQAHARLDAGQDAAEPIAARSHDDAQRMERARSAIVEALASLPRERDYARLAAQLRELASVSPSLLEWLGEVQGVTAPLATSVESLRVAAAELAARRGVASLGQEASPGGASALAADLLTLARALRLRLGTPGADGAALLRTVAAVQRELEQVARLAASAMMTVGEENEA
jgi:tetratricopeptide (TPR) repeat protein